MNFSAWSQHSPMTTGEQPIRSVADSLREIGFLQTLCDVSIQTRQVTYACHGSSDESAGAHAKLWSVLRTGNTEP